MKTAGSLLLIFGALLLSGFQTATWSTYTSLEGHFSISFPSAEPTITSQKVPVDDIEYLMHMIYAGPDNGFTYMIAWTDKSAHFPDKTVKQFLEGSRDGSISNIKGTNVVTEKIVTTGSQPYIEYTYNADKLKGKTRIYLINKVQYTILVLSENKTNFTATANKFIRSFSHN